MTSPFDDGNQNIFVRNSFILRNRYIPCVHPKSRTQNRTRSEVDAALFNDSDENNDDDDGDSDGDDNHVSCDSDGDDDHVSCGGEN